MLTKEFGLNVLTVTVNTGFLSDVALQNVKQSIDMLSVEHIMFTPGQNIFSKVYKHLLLNTKKNYVPSVCNICGIIMRGMILNLAYNLKVPLIMHAFAPYQGTGFGSYPFLLLKSKRWWEIPRKALGDELYEEIKKYLWNPYAHFFEYNLPKNYYPFHLLDYNIDENIKKIHEANLISKGNEDPAATNCKICYFLLLLDRKKLGYIPYIGEFSRLVRNGHYSRKECLKKFEQVEQQIKENNFHNENITCVLKKLGISLDAISNE